VKHLTFPQSEGKLQSEKHELKEFSFFYNKNYTVCKYT